MTQAQRVVHRCRRSVWWTGDRRLSPVYHTHQPPKLTAPETIDMTNSYGWCPPKFKWFTCLTPPLSGMVRHPQASTCYRQPIYWIWSLHLHSLRRYKRRYKMSKIGWFGVVRVTGNSITGYSVRRSLDISRSGRCYVRYVVGLSLPSGGSMYSLSLRGCL